MKKKYFIVFLVALINVTAVSVMPKYFLGNEIITTEDSYKYTERYKSIQKAFIEGEFITLEDLEYRDSEFDKSLDYWDKTSYIDLIGKNKVNIQVRSIVEISIVSSLLLIFLVLLRLFDNVNSLLVFSITSMLILTLAPFGQMQVFLTIIANSIFAYSLARFLVKK